MCSLAFLQLAAGQDDDIGRERGQFCRVPANGVGIGRCPPDVDLHIAPDGPTQLLQRLQEEPLVPFLFPSPIRFSSSVRKPA
jgi:hypothetical protein